MTGIPDTLDTRNIPPSMGGMGSHPPGIHDFQITNTYLKENSAGTGAFLTVECTSPAGKIEHRFNLFNPSTQAVEIANKELAALTHSINIFQVAFPKNPDGSPNMQMAGHTLRGGRGKMEIVPQKSKDATGKFVETGYMEVKRFFDVNGNEPGKSGGQPQAQPQQNAAAPIQQNPNGGGWSQPAQQQPATQQPANTGWANPQQGQPNAGQAQPNGNAGTGGPAPTGGPSWAR